jgi:hypothetical protein
LLRGLGKQNLCFRLECGFFFCDQCNCNPGCIFVPPNLKKLKIPLFFYFFFFITISRSPPPHGGHTGRNGKVYIVGIGQKGRFRMLGASCLFIYLISFNVRQAWWLCRQKQNMHDANCGGWMSQVERRIGRLHEKIWDRIG